MSKPRYNWWGFALNMIKDYPGRKKELEEIQRQNISAKINTAPGGGYRSVNRPTEAAAARQLPLCDQREYDAVQKAVSATGAQRDGETRLKVVSLTLFKNSHTIPGAALKLGISEDKAKKYRWEFVMATGAAFGLIDETEFRRQVSERFNGCKAIGDHAQPFC